MDVDDTLIGADTLEGVEAGKAILTHKYKTRDMGELREYLALNIKRDRQHKTLFLSAPGLTNTLLTNPGLDTANPTKVPMAAGTILGSDEAGPKADKTSYAELVGTFLYLATTTRPDLSYAVGMLARFMQAPELRHWQAAKMMLRYLVGTKEMRIMYAGGGGLTGTVDAGFGGFPKTRRSTTGWVFNLKVAAISWSRKRQATVSAYTAEAEYIAAAAATKEALWLTKLMADLRLPHGTVMIAEHNRACAPIANNPEGTGRAKHIDIAHHLVRERTATGEVKLYPIPSANQPSDGLTKPLGTTAFHTFRARLGIGHAVGDGTVGNGGGQLATH